MMFVDLAAHSTCRPETIAVASPFHNLEIRRSVGHTVLLARYRE